MRHNPKLAADCDDVKYVIFGIHHRIERSATELCYSDSEAKLLHVRRTRDSYDLLDTSLRVHNNIEWSQCQLRQALVTNIRVTRSQEVAKCKSVVGVATEGTPPASRIN